MIDLRQLDRFRNRAIAYQIAGGMTDPAMDRYHGIFEVPVKGSKRPLRVIASAGDGPGCHGWDHVSVSLPARCPTWAEMDKVKRMFFAPDEVAMQLHPAESAHISNHLYCLHIWRPVDVDLPLPPSILVGVRGLGEMTKEKSIAFVRGLQRVGRDVMAASGKGWCEQCEQLVSRDRAAACSSNFCKMRDAA